MSANEPRWVTLARTLIGTTEVKGKLHAPNLAVKDLKGRSVIIHAGGDNYSDQPAPLGGGGARIACGVIK